MINMIPKTMILYVKIIIFYYNFLKLIYLIIYVIGLTIRAKKQIFKLARHIPAIQDKINKELTNVNEVFQKDALNRLKDIPFTVKLPAKGLSDEKILNAVKQHVHIGKINQLV